MPDGIHGKWPTYCKHDRENISCFGDCRPWKFLKYVFVHVLKRGWQCTDNVVNHNIVRIPFVTVHVINIIANECPPQVRSLLQLGQSIAQELSVAFGKVELSRPAIDDA